MTLTHDQTVQRNVRLHRLTLQFILLNIGLLTFMYVTQAVAQESGEPPLTTDRPGIGDTAYLVPQGYIQLEGGVTYQHDRTRVPSQRITTVSAPNTLIRIGAFDVMELRFLGGEYVYEKISSGNQDDHDHGVSPPIIGTKFQLTEEGRSIPQTAIFLNLTLPFGNNRLHPDDVTPDFKMAGNYAISDRVSWEGNLGAAWEDGLNDITGFYTTALGVSITDKFTPFAEFFGNMNGPSTHAFDAGFTYLLQPTVQLDMWGGPALTDAATDWFIAAGISFRLPKLWQ
ncbi:transporter [Nitrospira sp. M1]